MSARRPRDRTFGLVFAALFAAIATLGWLLSGRVLAWAIGISGALLVTALLAPGLLMPFNRLWTRLGHRIGVVTNHLLLGIFFFLVVTPLGAVIRLLRLRSITKQPDPAAESYWTPVRRKATAETYADLF